MTEKNRGRRARQHYRRHHHPPPDPHDEVVGNGPDVDPSMGVGISVPSSRQVREKLTAAPDPKTRTRRSRFIACSRIAASDSHVPGPASDNAARCAVWSRFIKKIDARCGLVESTRIGL